MTTFQNDKVNVGNLSQTWQLMMTHIREMNKGYRQLENVLSLLNGKLLDLKNIPHLQCNPYWEILDDYNNFYSYRRFLLEK